MRHAGLAALVGALMLLLAGCGSSTSRSETVHVVSVGDSLAVGVQPQLGGSGSLTAQGYPRQFASALRERGFEIELHELGCGGATSASVLQGGRECAPEGDEPYRNEDALTSQVAYAEGLLSRLPADNTIVLVDIGGNDVGACLAGGAAGPACVTRAGQALRGNLRELLRRLRAAAPKAPIAVLDLYNPVLGLWDDHPEGRPTIAAVHQAFRAEVNTAIDRVATSGGARIGRLGRAMRQDDAVDPRDRRRPASVAEVCRLTWMCVSAPLRPDIHPRREGYAAASQALLTALAPDLDRLADRR